MYKYLALVSLLVLSCTTTAGTGRRQFIILSLEEEMQMGRQAYREVVETSKETILRNGTEVEMLRRVGEDIAYAAQTWEADPKVRKLARRFDWEFTLIEDDETVNAFVLPGGKCVVYTGLLGVTENEDGLAVVLGHEVSHAILRHGGERVSQSMALGAGLLLADSLWDANDEEKKENTMIALGLGAEFGVILPFSRSHESEADEFGLYLAASAGYNPQEAIPLWQRMAEEGSSVPEFLSSHPSEDTRIQRLEKVMPKALELYAK